MPALPPVALRRRLLLAGGMAGLLGASGGAPDLPARPLQFPRDFGAHPDFRTEWWYITGHASSGAREFGFQLTFFRSRVDGTQAMASKFAARQLIFAHAAITDVQGNKLWHDQRIAREGFDIASAGTEGMALKLRDWSLHSEGNTHIAKLPAGDFSLDLQFTETQPLLLQGDQGLSRKGPERKQASYYYSLPQLATRGALTVKGQKFEVTGKAWLDHEWSEE
ncbi:MAG: lipocalin-like domain-containing protein, partial [Polaromonas sp.]|uniref:lipocalin-like domain-containing protein n=1 Tax=Polaromonas sp. TaxID=1869339 RepID=UPI0040364544